MTTSEFTIPKQPADLTSEDCSYDVKVTNLRDLKQVSPADIRTYAHGVLYDLCNESALGITEADIFNKVYSLVNGFSSLDSISRKRLIDSLCSNLSVLSVSVNTLLGAEEGEERDETAASHCSAFKAYTFLLWWICMQAEREWKEAQPAAPQAPGAGRVGKGKKKIGGELNQWDWESQREKLLRCVGSSAEIDLWKLFRPKDPDSRLLQKWLQLASMMLESASALRNKSVKEATFRLAAALALKYRQLDVVSGALVDLLVKHEHLPATLAELAGFASHHYNDTRLGSEMLREVAAVDPHEYDQQQKEDAGGIRNVATFIQELAERLPKDVAANISLLVPHLGGKAYALRSAIVTATGHLIQNAYTDPPEEEADAQGKAARLRSKQHLLDTLVERARDQSAYTRARVMQTWASLAASRSIDMGHWLCVTELAIGRLEDKSALVRKQALVLLGSLLSFNPFAPQLPEDKFVATLEDYRRKLQELQPQDALGKDPLEDAIAEETDIDTEASETPAAEPSEPELMEEGEVRGGSQEASSGEIARLRMTIACMDTAVGFIRAMSGALQTLNQLLASATLSDVTEAIQLLVCYDKFCIAGSEAALRQMLPLIFSREQGVKDAVLGAIDELYIGDMPSLEAAQRLIRLADGLNLGELSSLEEVVKRLLEHEPSLLKPPVLNAMWTLVDQASKAPGPEAKGQLASGLRFIRMAAVKEPGLVASRLNLLLKIAFSEDQKDATVVREACAAVQQLSQLQVLPGVEAVETTHRSLVAVLVGGQLPERGWYSAAEAALRAIYALYPSPSTLCVAVLRRMAQAAFVTVSGGDESPKASAVAMSRFFFALGHVALQQLVYVEQTASAVRRARLAAEKRAAEAQAGQSASEEDDIAAQVGAGSATADTELDALKEAAEGQIVAGHNLVGQFSAIVIHFCHNRALMEGHSILRSSALLALTKLMALDPALCDQNLQMVFTLLQNRMVEPAIRCNLVIAVGDLAFRFPNVLEPWTHNIYRPLSDPDKGVVKNCLMVLTHLILNDMMKVRSHISRLALCLQDSDARIAALAQLFFHELSRKAFKGTNPVYNLLPDILSNLSGEAELPQKSFQDIMRHLLQYIGKEKHADSLVDKICARFGSTSDLGQWRNLAFCIAQLNYTEKGIRRMMELLKTFQAALFDDEILECFKAVIAKAKKIPKQSPEFKTEVEAFEEKLLATAAERKEEEATAEAARSCQSAREAASGLAETVTENSDPVEAAVSLPGRDEESVDMSDSNDTNRAAAVRDAETGDETQASTDDASQTDATVTDELGTSSSAGEQEAEGRFPSQQEPAVGSMDPEERGKDQSSIGITAQLGDLALDSHSDVQISAATRPNEQDSAKSTGKKAAGRRSDAAASRRSSAAAPGGGKGSRRSTTGEAGSASGVDVFVDENAVKPERSAKSGASKKAVRRTSQDETSQTTGVKAMRSLWEQRALVQTDGGGGRRARERR